MRVPGCSSRSAVWLCAAPAQAQTGAARRALGLPRQSGLRRGAEVRIRTRREVRRSCRWRSPTAGVGALDDGVAEVAVAFSSNPQVSRPDIVTLRDDRTMVYADRVVPVVRRGLLRAYGERGARDIRRRLNAASAALTTLALRGLNQAVIDGRLPEAVGGEFVDANGLGGGAPHRGPARGSTSATWTSPRTRRSRTCTPRRCARAASACACAASAGCGREAVARAAARPRSTSIPAYDGSLLRYLVGTSPGAAGARGCERTLARIDAEPMRLSRAQDRNVFVTKTDTAARLGLAQALRPRALLAGHDQVAQELGQLAARAAAGDGAQPVARARGDHEGAGVGAVDGAPRARGGADEAAAAADVPNAGCTATGAAGSANASRKASSPSSASAGAGGPGPAGVSPEWLTRQSSRWANGVKTSPAGSPGPSGRSASPASTIPRAASAIPMRLPPPTSEKRGTVRARRSGSEPGDGGSGRARAAHRDRGRRGRGPPTRAEADGEPVPGRRRARRSQRSPAEVAQDQRQRGAPAAQQRDTMRPSRRTRTCRGRAGASWTRITRAAPLRGQDPQPHGDCASGALTSGCAASTEPSAST